MERKVEHRFLPIELRADPEARKITGHAAIFDSISYSGMYFAEKIAKGAFKESIKKDDIRALFNHNPDYVLGRNIAKTLTLKEDELGLAIEINPPDTQFARDLMVSISRGDISQMSFGFEITNSDDVNWNEDEIPPLRTIRKAKLWDISPVTFPFYEDTDVALKSLAEYRSQVLSHTNVQPPVKHQKQGFRRDHINLLKRRF